MWFAALSLAAGCAFAQTTNKSDLLANFTGTVVSITKSDIALQGDAGNALVFSVSRHTKFLRAGKSVGRGDIHPGDPVSIQAGEDPTGHPSAITVTVVPPGKPNATQPSK